MRLEHERLSYEYALRQEAARLAALGIRPDAISQEAKKNLKHRGWNYASWTVEG